MRIRVPILILALSGAAYAQSDGELAEKLAEKMKKPFVSRIAWETDWGKARERADKEGKLVFGYFTRSFKP